MNRSKSVVFLDKYIFNPLYFKIIMLIMTLFTAIPYVHSIIGGYVKYGLAFGILICIWSLFNGSFKLILKNKMNIPLFVFSGFYLITILVHRDNFLSENINQWVYMVVFFYIFCGIESVRTPEESRKDFNIISVCFISITFCFAVISFVMFVIGYSYWYQIEGNETWFVFGMNVNRLCGLYNSNTCGALSALSIIISCLFVINSKKAIVIALNIVNIVVEYFCLVLSYSRGAIYTLIIVLSTVVFCLLLEKFNKNNFKIIISIFLSIIFAFSMIGVDKLTRNVLAYVPSLVEKNETAMVAFVPLNFNNPYYNPTYLELDKVDIERDDINNDGDVTTGRKDLWIAGLKTFKDFPFLGIPIENTKEYSIQFVNRHENRVDGLQNGGFHSMYITVLACSGLFGFLILTLYFLNLIIELLKNRKDLIQKLYRITPFLIALFMLISEMFENRILYRVGIFNVIFWISMGVIQNYIINNSNKDFPEEIINENTIFTT